MKWAALAALLGVMGTDTQALAAGAAINWDDCFELGSSSRVFACDMNSGSETVIVWFYAPGDAEPINGAEAYLQVAFSNDVMPPWWQIKGASACRDSAVRVFANFPGQSRCINPWATGTLFGFNYFPDNSAPGHQPPGSMPTLVQQCAACHSSDSAPVPSDQARHEDIADQAVDQSAGTDMYAASGE